MCYLIFQVALRRMVPVVRTPTNGEHRSLSGSYQTIQIWLQMVPIRRDALEASGDILEDDHAMEATAAGALTLDQMG